MNLPFTDTGTSPAISTPRLTITPTPAGGAGAALGGLADVASNLLGGADVADPWQSYLLDLRLHLSLAARVDCAVIHLLEGDGAPATELGDSFELAININDDTDSKLFTGSICAIETSISGYRRLLLSSPALSLARARRNSSFEAQAAGDMINALCAELELETDQIDGGSSYPFYAISDRHSLLDHIHQLAQQQNWLCYFNPDGKLNAHAFAAGPAAHTFSYGTDLSRLECSRFQSAAGGFTVIGGGASGSQGGDAWNWLTKTPKAMSTGGDGNRIVQQRALRDQAATRIHADFLAARAARSNTRVRLQAAAVAGVTPASGFSVEGAPDSAANGSYVAEQVIVEFDRQRGFVTTIDGFSAASAAGGLPGLGGLL